MIREKKGVTAGLKLRFGDQLLQDSYTLSDYNIQDGATISIGRMNVHVHVPTMLVVVPSKVNIIVSKLCTHIMYRRSGFDCVILMITNSRTCNQKIHKEMLERILLYGTRLTIAIQFGLTSLKRNH